MDQSCIDYRKITALVTGWVLVEYIDILAKADIPVMGIVA